MKIFLKLIADFDSYDTIEATPDIQQLETGAKKTATERIE